MIREDPIPVSGRTASRAGWRFAAPWIVAVCALWLPGACGFQSPPPQAPDPEGIVRIAPLEAEGDEDDDAPRVIDPERMKESLARRFPGVRTIDFIRIFVTPDERSGSCWTEISRPWETDITIDYAIGGKKESGSGIADLKSMGWWPTYRSPEGFGLERRASFDSLDVTLATRFACRCVSGPLAKDGGWQPLEVRLRWTSGGMPEVSGAVTKNGTRRVLTPRSTWGHLLTWDYRASGDRCGVHATLSILNDPPIL